MSIIMFCLLLGYSHKNWITTQKDRDTRGEEAGRKRGRERESGRERGGRERERERSMMGTFVFFIV